MMNGLRNHKKRFSVQLLKKQRKIKKNNYII
jgi:hypothetical protein